MNKKLTITVEESVIKKAKSYAKHTSRSLSELIENYLDTLTFEHKDTEQISPKLKKIAGAVKLPHDFDEKSALNAYHEAKLKVSSLVENLTGVIPNENKDNYRDEYRSYLSKKHS